MTNSPRITFGGLFHKGKQSMQMLELVDHRFEDLLNGLKRDTIRWNEGQIQEGFLRYIACHDKTLTCIVWVTVVQKIQLKDVPMIPHSDHYRENPSILLEKMKRHYPEITLETEIDYILHLTPEETRQLKGSPKT